MRCTLCWGRVTTERRRLYSDHVPAPSGPRLTTRMLPHSTRAASRRACVGVPLFPRDRYARYASLPARPLRTLRLYFHTSATVTTCDSPRSPTPLSGSTIGAAQLLPAEEGASLEIQLSGASDVTVAQAALGWLRDLTRLESVGVAARERALQWSEAAYGAALHAHLERLGAARSPSACVE